MLELVMMAAAAVAPIPAPALCEDTVRSTKTTAETTPAELVAMPYQRRAAVEQDPVEPVPDARRTPSLPDSQIDRIVCAALTTMPLVPATTMPGSPGLGDDAEGLRDGQRPEAAGIDGIDGIDLAAGDSL
jgi:hypothetical protein